MQKHHFENKIIQSGRREGDQPEIYLHRNESDSPPRLALAEPEAVLQGGEEQERHEYDEIDIG